MRVFKVVNGDPAIEAIYFATSEEVARFIEDELDCRFGITPCLSSIGESTLYTVEITEMSETEFLALEPYE